VIATPFECASRRSVENRSQKRGSLSWDLATKRRLPLRQTN